MCLAVVAIGAHPRYPLVVAANRDEYHARPAAPLDWWDAGGVELVAGRDLQAGGTWFGATRGGRWCLVTNVRDPARHDPAAPSRGELVTRYLRDGRPPVAALGAIVAAAAGHNGFNLVAGVGASAAWASNRAGAPLPLEPGVHAVSNALLDTPWPKVERARAALADWTRRGSEDPAPLLAALRDRTLAPDHALPATGVSLEWERALSAPFIVTAGYGTRCTTLLTLDRDGRACMTEWRFGVDGAAAGASEQRFALDPAVARASAPT